MNLVLLWMEQVGRIRVFMQQIQVEKEIAEQYGIQMNFEPFGQKESEPEVDKGGKTDEN